jgi:two-component system cell cycle sensor histidine kinase/response regulator CckA
MEDSMKRILLVEDNLGDARLAQELLAESSDFEAHVTCVGRVSDAEDILSNQPIDLVLLDLSLPDSQGLESLRRLQPLSQYAPIIVLSGSSDKALALEALKHGAQDYLIKGTINAEALTRIIQYSIERKITEMRYRSLVSNIPGVVYRCQSDLNCSMVYVSNPFELLTGYSPDEFGVVLSSHYAELIHPDDREATAREILDAVSRKQPYSVEYRIIRKDATIRSVRDSGQSIGGNNGAPPTRDGVLFDITTQKHLEETVRRADHQLGKARQFAALGHLAGGIAHDFNNLITAINGFADLALKELSTDSRPHAHLVQIKKASARAMTITQQLLTLGQPNEQEVTLVDLNLLLQEMERLVRLVVGSDRRIEILTEQLLGRVRINPGQLEQAILVLAANLFEGRGVEDHLQIETKSWEVSKEDAELLGFVFGGPYVAVTLRAWSHKGRQTEIVHALRAVSQGSETVSDWGFGLSGVLKIVMEHQGYLLDSRDEIGIREYQIALPVAKIHDETWASCEPASQPSRAGTETVLVVDDEESIRKLLRTLLEPEGYSVLEASGGLQAIELSVGYKKKIDLLIVDEIMPEISGHELVDRLVLDRPLMGILPMSTRNRELHDDKKPSLLKPFLQKPFTAEGLLRLVSKSLNDRHTQPMAEIEH